MPRISVDFTDGDTFKRVTVTDAAVNGSSLISVSVQRRNVADVDDGGWLFIANPVTTAAGSFDVNVAALPWGEVPVNSEGPNETVVLVYTLQ